MLGFMLLKKYKYIPRHQSRGSQQGKLCTATTWGFFFICFFFFRFFLYFLFYSFFFVILFFLFVCFCLLLFLFGFWNFLFLFTKGEEKESKGCTIFYRTAISSQWEKESRQDSSKHHIHPKVSFGQSCRGVTILPVYQSLQLREKFVLPSKKVIREGGYFATWSWIDVSHTWKIHCKHKYFREKGTHYKQKGTEWS